MLQENLALTLLQRFDRIFARHQSEGRVPYLDQEIVVLSVKFQPHEKVNYVRDGRHISKIPLRTLAKEIGLPEYVYMRGKEKMTAGATGRENATAPDGYLEVESRALKGVSFAELVESCYREQFFTNGNDLWLRPDTFFTEEQVMERVNAYQRANAQDIRKKEATHAI